MSCLSVERTPSASSSGAKGFGWRCGQKIGHGSYGTVYKAQDKLTGCIFAVKKAAFSEGSEDECKQRAKLQEELDICKSLRHPHIVSYLGHDYDGSHLYIKLEYVSGGSMASVLNEFGALEATQLRMATQGLLEGLDHLHSRNPPVVHRDIKGANVLVDLNFCVKLADFGCSKCDVETRSFTTIGSVPWMAPEVIQANGHGRKADIWSFGCTVIEMASAEKPWGNGAFDNLMVAIRHIGMSDALPPIPETVSDTCRDLVCSCVNRKPEERPTAAELLEHRFLKEAPNRDCMEFTA